MIIWFTGLSGSGKTTLSDRLRDSLKHEGFTVFQVDGDTFRKKEKSKNVFSKKEIIENNYKIVAYCQAIRDKYDVVIVSVISPYQQTRRRAREVFGDHYREIFLDCALKTLIERDPKKLYAKALCGKIDNVIGFSPQSPYECPQKPDLTIHTDSMSISSSLKAVRKMLKNNGTEE